MPSRAAELVLSILMQAIAVWACLEKRCSPAVILSFYVCTQLFVVAPFVLAGRHPLYPLSFRLGKAFCVCVLLCALSSDPAEVAVCNAALIVGVVCIFRLSGA